MITKQSASIYFKEKEKRAVRTIGQMVATFTATKKEDKTKTAYHIFAYEGIQTLVNKMPTDTKSILVIDDIGCQLIKEFVKKGITDITYCCTVNDKNLFDRIVYYIKNVFSSYSLKFKMVKELKGMEFDYIAANPPYSIGNSITKFIIENVTFKKYVNLMPLSCYKDKDTKQELVKAVSNLELADPKWFEDANITDNLCICTLEKNVNRYDNYEKLALESYDKNYYEFHKLNLSIDRSYQILPNCSKDNFSQIAANPDTDIIFQTRAANCKTDKKTTPYYRFNREYNLQCLAELKSLAYLIRMPNVKAKINLCTLVYDNPEFKNLIDSINNPQGCLFAAIPNLDYTKTRDYAKLTSNDIMKALKEDNPEVK